MWHQGFNRNFIKLQKYVLCAKKTKIPTLFNNSLRALGFHQRYLNLCSKDEQMSYGFGTKWGWEMNDIISIFGWTIPLTRCVRYLSSNGCLWWDIYIYFVLNKICHFKSPIACHYIYHVFVVHCGIFQGANVPVQWKDFPIERPLKGPLKPLKVP